MLTLRSYALGEWRAAGGRAATLVNPATEEPVGEVARGDLDRAAVLRHAREAGGSALRAMSFAERAERLGRMSEVIQEAREELIELAVRNGGNTRSDAKFDVDGASFSLSAYAEVGAAFDASHALSDGPGVPLGRSPRFHGQHVLVPRRGVAVHVNAFNFPAWGFAEKAAVALLAGMPVVTKPATSSALVACRIVERVVERGLLPEGALQLLTDAGDLLDHLGPQDVLAFTGSGATGRHVRGLPSVIRNAVRVNVEADSLNAAVLGPDAEPDSELLDYFLKDVVRDVTQKAGQKCTAIRRVLVPVPLLSRVREGLADLLGAVTVGNPAEPGVRMGPVATASQLEDVLGGIGELSACGRLLLGGAERVPGVGAPEGKGFFVAPTLVEVAGEAAAAAVHEREVFGPVATLVPYPGHAAAAVDLVARGQGGLVSSVYSDDTDFATELALGLAPYHGRVFLGSSRIAELSPGPGTVLPSLVHGGPGRAGGGEELGGERGLAFYMQRVALQGARPVVERIAGR